MRNTHIITSLALVAGLLLTACGGAPEPSPTATISPDQIRTEAVQTFSADLTLTALANPTDTPTATQSPTTFATIAIGSAAATGTEVSSCYRLLYVRDVTIPDNTNMTPGQTFTKTWEVQNSGTCAWNAGFQFTLIGGDAMGGQTLTLAQAVPANSTTQLSVAMTAPTGKTGALQGTWRMATAGGEYFGNPLTVVIVIGGGAVSETPTSTPTPTPTH
jgi:hypothetical protein